MTKEEVFNLIRQRLSFGDELQQQLRHVDKDKFIKEHRRFEMSGFETQTGWCTVFNNDILNKFADLGIYNYTSYLFLDRKSTRLNSSHKVQSRMPSSA